MATLTAQQIARTGLTPSYASAAGGGDQVLNPDGDIFLHVKNGSGGSLTVTVASEAVASPGLVQSDVAVAVGAGAEAMIGPFPTTGFNDADGYLQITYSGVTSLTIAALKL